MPKYTVIFSKKDLTKYASHLDLVRLFRRSLKKTNIALEYSNGFHPHPKMSFPLPLSLGYESTCEIFEFQTKTICHLKPEDIKERLSLVMPEGITIESCVENGEGYKGQGSQIVAAEYIIGFPVHILCGCQCGDCNGSSGEDQIEKFTRAYWEKVEREFMSQEEIIVKKKSKDKKRKNKFNYKDIDIKSKIRTLNIDMVDNTIFMTTIIDQGSISNLSPELLIDAMIEFTKLGTTRDQVKVIRTEVIHKANC